MPMFWADDDLELLRGSLVEKLVAFTRTNLTTLVNNVAEPFNAFYSSKTGIPFTATMEDLMWALGTVWSRGYWLEDNVEPCLVPLADMLNHTHEHVHDGGVAAYAYDRQRKCFRVTSRVTVAKGAQVFTFYGDKTNYEFLNDYGFLIPAPTPHRRDVLLNLPLWRIEESDGPATFEFKLRLLDRVGLSSRVAYLGGDQGAALVVASRIIAMTSLEAEKYANDGDAAVALLMRNSPVRTVRLNCPNVASNVTCSLGS